MRGEANRRSRWRGTGLCRRVTLASAAVSGRFVLSLMAASHAPQPITRVRKTGPPERGSRMRNQAVRICLNSWSRIDPGTISFRSLKSEPAEHNGREARLAWSRSGAGWRTGGRVREDGGFRGECVRRCGERGEGCTIKDGRVWKIGVTTRSLSIQGASVVGSSKSVFPPADFNAARAAVRSRISGLSAYPFRAAISSRLPARPNTASAETLRIIAASASKIWWAFARAASASCWA